MATSIELAKELSKKRGEFKEFIKSKTTESGLKFEGDDTTAFNDRDAELNKLQDEYNEVKRIEDAAKKNDDGIKSLNEIDRKVRFSPSGDEEQDEQRGRYIKSLGEMFMESAEYKANAHQSPGTQAQWQAELPQGSLAIKADSYTTAGGGTGVLPYANPGRFAEFPARRPVLRQLMSVQDTSVGGQAFATVQFIRENVQTLNGAVVAEGATKPLSELGDERVVLTLEAIAHRITVTNQALTFIPGIRERIDRKGTYGVMIAEEDAMLNYDGSAGWKGLMVQSGVQTDALSGVDQFTGFHRGMTYVANGGASGTGSNAEVTGFAIHPNDWHKVLTIKDTTGRFIYGDPSAATREVRLWGVPGVSTVKATEGTVVMGDFAQDIVWWVAGGIRIIVGYVNDDLAKNKQTIVIEEYGALEIDRPASFLKQTGW